MDNINVTTSEALNNYYEALEKTGYVKQSDVNKLLLLTFLNDFLEKYEGYITEEDYNMICNMISCIADTTCFVPLPYRLLPSYVVYKQQILRKAILQPLRNTLDSYFRLVNN